MFILGLLAAVLGQTSLPPAKLHIDAGAVRNRITPWMTGSCIEDVNHEIYGGLYAQMIFGESFEEPPADSSPLAGWKAYGGQWHVNAGACHVEAEPGAKLVRDSATMLDGQVECDVRLDDDKGDNAGLIVRVSDPRNGADSWIGYEVSLSYRNHAVILGRHRNDWTLLRSAPASVSVGEWHRLRVAMEGPVIRVWLDAPATGRTRPLIEVNDGAQALPAGRVGVRTWNSNAAFRNLKVTSRAVSLDDPMNAPNPAIGTNSVSGMWTSFTTGAAHGRFALDTDQPYNSLQSQRIEHEGGAGTVGVFNKGLNHWGIAIRAGHRYAGRLYARQPAGSAGLVVALQSSDGTRTYASAELRGAASDWTRRDVTLTPNSDDPHARFAVMLDRAGTASIDQVTLMPTGRDLFHGLPIRADIGQALVDQGLTFLRYGGSMVNAPGYRWKQMIGPRNRRPQYRGTWYPYSTNGFGIEEFVQFCRASRIEPAVAINVEESPADAADLVEYLNGPADSPWGQKRAKNGHAAPYNVRYIEIGNEETTNEHYLERFKLLEPAMHRVDPTLQLVIAAWWEPNNPVSRRIVEELRGKAALWDVHVGGDDLREGSNVDALFTRMEQLVKTWSPGTDLKACVFEENGGRHDLQRALGHARVLNATERHGDFVLMDCPANCLQPLGQNDNGWNQGQVFFTPSRVWGMPPFYAQQMFALNYLPVRVESRVDAAPSLDVTATRSADGTVLALQVVNIGDAPLLASVDVRRFELPRQADVWTLTGQLTDINTPERPDAVRWRKSSVAVDGPAFTYTFPARSFTILRLRRTRAAGAGTR